MVAKVATSVVLVFAPRVVNETSTFTEPNDAVMRAVSVPVVAALPAKFKVVTDAVGAVFDAVNVKFLKVVSMV